MSCHCGKKCIICKTMWALVIIGALNWGLIGVGNFIGSNLNLVNLIFGSLPVLENIVYTLVGVAAIYNLVQPCGCTKCKCNCDMKKDGAPTA